MQQAASAPPLAIHGALCEAAQDYTRKKNVFRLALTDGSEYLFMAQDGNQMGDWVSQIKFHAGREIYVEGVSSQHTFFSIGRINFPTLFGAPKCV